MSLRGVLRAGDVGIRVTDLERDTAHYVDVIGLDVTARGEGWFGMVTPESW